MATTRKPKVTQIQDLAELIEKLANGPKATTAITVDLTGTKEKLVTDRIRRLPRLNGWKALSVRKVDSTDTTVTLEVTSTGLAAAAWPAKKAAAKKAAPKATRKAASAAKATSASKKAPKATSGTRKAKAAKPAAKATTRKVGVTGVGMVDMHQA